MDFYDGVSHTMLIHDGYALPRAILRLGLGGRDFTVCGYLSRPPQRGRSVVMSKRNFATVLLTATQSSKRLCSLTETSSLSVMNVSVARVFFKPSVIGKETSGVHDTSSQNVMSCDVYIRVNLHANVMLPSGTTMFQEILTSMTKELTVLPPSSMRSMWLLHQRDSTRCGLRGLSCLPSTFQHVSTSKGVFNESGPFAVHKKCLVVPSVFLIVHGERSSPCDSSHFTGLTCTYPCNSSKK